MRIVLSGGGTGGHITPILAIARALQAANKSVELIYVGERSQVAHELLAGSHLPAYYVRAGKFRRYHTEAWLKRVADIKTHSLNLRDSIRIVSGLAASLRLLRRLKPDVVLANGGYVGLPVGLAAAILRIPLVIHEADTRLGLTNRVLARYATSIAVGWPASHYKLRRSYHLVETGNPVRSELFAQTVTAAKKQLKLGSHKPVVTVVGGSSGAQRLNTAIFNHIFPLVQNFQLIHVTGSYDIAQAQILRRGLAADLREDYHPYDFLKQPMGAAIMAADVVVSRAGATTLAELALAGKPSVIVPNHLLTGGHQSLNAGLLQKQKAAVILSEQEADSQRLLKELKTLTGSTAARRALSTAIKKLAKPNATQAMAKLLLEAGNGTTAS